MIHRIRKQVCMFSASHRLIHLPADHPCARLHGHNYTVWATLEGPIDRDTGMIEDFRSLGLMKRWIDEQWDHRDLNEWFKAKHPRGKSCLEQAARSTTSERLSQFLLVEFASSINHLVSVRVSETPKTWAEATFA